MAEVTPAPPSSDEESNYEMIDSASEKGTTRLVESTTDTSESIPKATSVGAAEDSKKMEGGEGQAICGLVELLKDVERSRRDEVAKKDEEIAKLRGLLEKAAEDKKIDEKFILSMDAVLRKRETLIESLLKKKKAQNKKEQKELEKAKALASLKETGLPNPATRSITMTRGRSDKFGLWLFGTTLVWAVQGGSPAEKSGVKQGDEIMSVNGIELDGRWTDRTYKLFEGASEGGTVDIVVRYNPALFWDKTVAAARFVICLFMAFVLSLYLFIKYVILMK